VTEERRVAEGWPAVIVAYHIGLGLSRQAGFIAVVIARMTEEEWSREVLRPAAGGGRRTLCSGVSCCPT
jgi:hypothetical protein